MQMMQRLAGHILPVSGRLAQDTNDGYTVSERRTVDNILFLHSNK